MLPGAALANHGRPRGWRAGPPVQAISYRRSVVAAVLRGQHQGMYRSPSVPGPIQPACTLARGRPETLINGRDGGYRYAPPPSARNTMVQDARAAAKR
jgi:hypothetical protein